MSTPVRILDQYGNQVVSKRRRPQALNGGGGRYTGPAYDAADLYGQHMSEWQPYLWSPDGELNMYRDRIVSRVRDLVRNDGWASGAVTRILDNAIGANIRPIPKPDHIALKQISGLKAFDHVWAKEYAKAVDAGWRTWAVEDIGNYCDVARNQTFGEIAHTAFRHKLIDGDALAVMHWLPERVSRGRARYSTAIQLIDPDRLSNPQLRFDQQSLRGGCEVDKLGATIAYHIRKAHQGDWFSAADSMTWERVPRETAWGRPVVIHNFDGDRATQHRGGAGVFTPVLQRLKMLVKYDGVELDAALINAIFGAYIESPFDHELVGMALDDGEKLSGYQEQRMGFHDASSISLGNSRIPVLFPGEKINTVAASRPSENFAAFESAMLRNVATGLGLSAQQVTNDWSDVNYSSARGATLEAFKTLSRRRDNFTMGFCAPVRAAWQEEAHSVDDLPLPTGAPEFMDARGAYMRCRWLGPAQGYVDPVNEAKASIMRMDGAISTLEDECADQGLDYEEVLEQRAYEIQRFKDLGIPLPEWAAAVEPVSKTITDPPLK